MVRGTAAPPLSSGMFAVPMHIISMLELCDARGKLQSAAWHAQVAAKRDATVKEIEQAAQGKQRALEDLEATKSAEKTAKAAKKAQKAAALAERKAAFLEEQERRYAEAKDEVPERHAFLHKEATTGAKRGFTTLPCVYPSI